VKPELTTRAIVVFIALQLLDVITTVLGLRVGAYEGNFVVARLMHWGPELGLLLAKFLGFLVLLLMHAAGRLRLLRMLNTWFALLVTWNLLVIWFQRLFS
jgi:hypothetical protein